jgi:hypothetical protein
MSVPEAEGVWGRSSRDEGSVLGGFGFIALVPRLV